MCRPFCCLRAFGLNFLPQLRAKGGNFCPEVCQDNLTGEQMFLMKKFHCQLDTLRHLASLVSLAVIYSCCSLVYFFLAARALGLSSIGWILNNIKIIQLWSQKRVKCIFFPLRKLRIYVHLHPLLFCKYKQVEINSWWLNHHCGIRGHYEIRLLK